MPRVVARGRMYLHLCRRNVARSVYSQPVMVNRGVLLAGVFVAITAANCGDNGGSGEGTVGSTSTASTTNVATATTMSPTTGMTSVSGGSGGEGSSSGPPGSTGSGAATTGGPGGATTEASTGSASTGGDTTTGGDAQVVRFVVLGDTGEGNEDQYSVAQAIVEICAQRGCDFGVLTGDNFYDTGVSGVDDPQWQTKFEDPYMDIEFPMYAVLGNHDYGGNGIGVDFDLKKADYQVQYTQKSQLWQMPARYYDFSLAHADFWGLDTNQVMTHPINGNSDTQKAWLQAGVAGSTATWKIAFGHHPYISNGDHGNAGSYENLEAIPLPFVTGEKVKEFMEDAVCGKIDVYICGHDHSLQWLEAKCGTEFIISGAGSKAEMLPGSNPAHYEIAEMEGFLWVELKDGSFTGVLYDKTGAELFTRTLMK